MAPPSKTVDKTTAQSNEAQEQVVKCELKNIVINFIFPISKIRVK